MRTFVTKLKLVLLAGFLIFPALGNSAALDDLIIKKISTANEVVIRLIMSGVISDTPVENDDRELAQGICLAGGVASQLCTGGYYQGKTHYSPKTLAQGICLAGGVASQLCTGGYYQGKTHYSPSSLEEALQLVMNSNEDRYWYWDKFRDQYSNPQWRCRGSQTGQFANNSKCSGQTKDDERWPG